MMNTRPASFPLMHLLYTNHMQSRYRDFLYFYTSLFISDAPDLTQTFPLSLRNALFN